MELTRKQVTRGRAFYLIFVEEVPKTDQSRYLVVNLQSRTVQRVKNVSLLLKTGEWKALTKGDPTLDELTQIVPALRPFRGIEVRLKTGTTAWVRWRQWSSEDAAGQRLLTQTTHLLAVPTYEPDGDYYLAVQAMAALGGEVLDPPRSAFSVEDNGY